MNDEIKEILDILKYCVEKNEYLEVPNMKEWKPLLDYITNLQQENEEWGMVFDTFSSRPYAHRYLEEKRKELGNKRIMGLDSEMIYKEYYDLKEIEQDHKETNATLMSELAKLEEENEELKMESEKLTQLWLDSQEKRRKAIEYLEQPYRDNFDYSKAELLNILQNGSDDNE